MTTLHEQSFLTEILEGKPIPFGKLEYFRARLRSRLHQLVVSVWMRQETVTQADLARRIGRKPEVINRLLGAPGNWTLYTVSDLLVALGVDLDKPSVTPIAELFSRPTQPVPLGNQTNALNTVARLPVYQPIPTGVGAAANASPEISK